MEVALGLADDGFRLFPVRPNDKRPAHEGWQQEASRDPEQLRKWFATRDFNLGVCMGECGPGQVAEPWFCATVDIDVKKGKPGLASWERLKVACGLSDSDLSTVSQETPSSGRHYIFRTREPLGNVVDLPNYEGIDIRGIGGYIVAAPSVVDGKWYRWTNTGDLAMMPEALEAILPKAGAIPALRLGGQGLPNIDPERAEARALSYLAEVKVSTQGSRNTDAYRVAAKLKDFGCDYDQTLELMLETWNPMCEPPMDEAELEQTVRSMFRTSQNPQGIDAPEAIFPAPEPSQDPLDELNPLERLNKRFAFVFHGGFILHETTDEHGAAITRHLRLSDFHSGFANQMFHSGDKVRSISKAWMEWAPPGGSERSMRRRGFGPNRFWRWPRRNRRSLRTWRAPKARTSPEHSSPWPPKRWPARHFRGRRPKKSWPHPSLRPQTPARSTSSTCGMSTAPRP